MTLRRFKNWFVFAVAYLVLTWSASAASSIKNIVFIAAHAPDEGETEAGNGKKFPNSTQPLVRTPDGFRLLDPANFAKDVTHGV